MKYSPTSRGFYDQTVHGNAIPSDAVEITNAEHKALLDGQSQGRQIIAAADGRPILTPLPERTLSDAIVQKLAALADHRWHVETGGITVNGITVATDRESQSLLTGAWCRCQQDPTVLINWKGSNGWAQVDQATIAALSVAVSSHVEACFSAERTHGEAISALTTIEDVDAYDFSAGWPG